MNLEQKVNDELKKAMKESKKDRVDVLRSLRSSIIEFNKSGARRELNEDDEIKILNSAAKKRKDAIEMYEKANRNELAEKEKIELKVIQEFLPKQLTDDEIKEIIKSIIEKTGAKDMKDMGKVMGASMKALKGKADGNKVQTIVKEILG